MFQITLPNMHHFYCCHCLTTHLGFSKIFILYHKIKVQKLTGVARNLQMLSGLSAVAGFLLSETEVFWMWIETDNTTRNGTLYSGFSSSSPIFLTKSSSSIYENEKILSKLWYSPSSLPEEIIRSVASPSVENKGGR